MPIYTLYPYRADGSALTFLALDVADVTAASAPARRLLQEHASADCVEVWCDESLVLTLRREASISESEMATSPSSAAR